MPDKPRSKLDSFEIILAASLFLILVGSRAALIGFAGSPTPYMDEWDGDWGGLIRPFVDGTLSLDQLTAPFNEHRILLTRLLVLLIFKLSGYWDVVLQMIVNAVVGSALIVTTAFVLARVLTGGWAVAAIVASCLVNVVPFAFDNILLGFNTHFFLLPALSLAALWLGADSRAWTARWAAGALCGAAAFFAMASGALTLAVLAATHGLQMASGRRKGFGEGLGIAALAIAAAILIAFVPHVPQSDAFRARSVGEFLSAVVILAQWPGGAVFGWLLPLPSALFCLRLWADRPALDDARWFNLAALAWVGAQIVALALGRAQMVPQSRYFDTLILGLILHFVSALWLVERRALGRAHATAAALALAAWVAILGVMLPRTERHLPRQIEAWRETVETGGENARFYLATGDRSFLAGPRAPIISYTEPDRLRTYLDAPEARAYLPPQLLSREPPRTAVEAAKGLFLCFAPGFVSLGAAALMGALVWRSHQQEAAREERARTALLVAERVWKAPA